MRVLHTSDWHLGKYIENESRLPEQKMFLDELIEILDDEKIDLIIVAGDIYDNSNPPAAAEKLFFEYSVKLTKKGKRPMVIISGNHDSPQRLGAAKAPLMEIGVIIVDYPETIVDIYENENFRIITSSSGFFEINVNNERAVIVNMPFPSEKRLNAVLSSGNTEEEMQADYSQKIGAILKGLTDNFRYDTVNIITGHFFVAGGEESASERNIALGGAMAVRGGEIPANSQYIALGHLHRPQRVHCGALHAYYSGSPIQYSKSELNYSKSVYIADIRPSEEALVTKRYLRNYKPIEVWRAKSISEAIDMCKGQSAASSWVYIEIETDRVIEPAEIRQMRENRKDILEIAPIFESDDFADSEMEIKEQSFEEDFLDFYRHSRGIEPSGELMAVLTEIINAGDSDEADNA